MSKFAITYTPCFRNNMLKEIRGVDKDIKVIDSLSDGVLILESVLGQDDFTKRIVDKSPIFVKHCMPIMNYGILSNDFSKDKISILNSVSSISSIKKDDPFAVQCRIINGGVDYSSKDLEVFIGSLYEKYGCKPVFSDSKLINDNVNIISILISRDKYYSGFSTSKNNLNFHCDEYRICAKNGREISRAENKLKEAITKFNINLNGGYALDIGAAPGGWTKVLCDYGYNVIAVDPGKLRPELENNPSIKHYKCRIEDLKFNNYFDIIVNDMNVEPQTTAKIMNSLSDTLKEGGMSIVTLKLPNNFDNSIRESVSILNDRYDVLNIKSLFHNRQEVTALIKKKTLVKENNESNSINVPSFKKY